MSADSSTSTALPNGHDADSASPTSTLSAGTGRLPNGSQTQGGGQGRLNGQRSKSFVLHRRRSSMLSASGMLDKQNVSTDPEGIAQDVIGLHSRLGTVRNEVSLLQQEVADFQNVLREHVSNELKVLLSAAFSTCAPTSEQDNEAQELDAQAQLRVVWREAERRITESLLNQTSPPSSGSLVSPATAEALEDKMVWVERLYTEIQMVNSDLSIKLNSMEDLSQRVGCLEDKLQSVDLNSIEDLGQRVDCLEDKLQSVAMAQAQTEVDRSQRHLHFQDPGHNSETSSERCLKGELQGTELGRFRTLQRQRSDSFKFQPVLQGTRSEPIHRLPHLPLRTLQQQLQGYPQSQPQQANLPWAVTQQSNRLSVDFNQDHRSSSPSTQFKRSRGRWPSEMDGRRLSDLGRGRIATEVHALADSDDQDSIERQKRDRRPSIESDYDNAFATASAAASAASQSTAERRSLSAGVGPASSELTSAMVASRASSSSADYENASATASAASPSTAGRRSSSAGVRSRSRSTTALVSSRASSSSADWRVSSSSATSRASSSSLTAAEKAADLSRKAAARTEETRRHKGMGFKVAARAVQSARMLSEGSSWLPDFRTLLDETDSGSRSP